MLDVLIREQRWLNPSRPKFPLAGEFQYQNVDGLVTEVRERGYRFTGCYWMAGELWSEVDVPWLVEACEFVLVGGSEWGRRRYLYLPLDRCRDLVPSVRVGDGGRLVRVYPSASDLVVGTGGETWVVEGVGDHVLLPGMTYGGRVGYWDGGVWYQWVDAVGDYGELGAVYWSRLRPRGLDSPLGVVGWDALVERDVNSLGYYPRRLESGWVGGYTGYVVEWRGVTWYQYMSSDRRFMLLDSPPWSEGRAYWDYWRGLDGVGVGGEVVDSVVVSQNVVGTLEVS